MSYNYLISGYFVRSDRPIEGLAIACIAPGNLPQVIVETLDVSHPAAPRGTVDRSRFSFSASPDLLFTIQGGSRISIFKGDRISAQEVNLFLLGSAWGVLCHQRGQFPMHCSSVSIGIEAFAFIADSGGGKSTLAASLCGDDVRHVCDDVAILDLDAASGVGILAMPKGLKLWREASDVLGFERQTLAFSQDDREKYYVAPPKGPEQARLDLSAIYEIHFADTTAPPSIERVRGIEAVKTIYRNIYKVEWLDLLEASDRGLKQARFIAERVPLYRYTRARALPTLKDSSRFLAEHIRSLRSAET